MPKTLSLWSSGPDVRSAQTALNASPPSKYPLLKVDGIFGAKTLQRAKEFQAAKRLTVDGVIGPITWAALLKSNKTPVVPMAGTLCGTCDEANAGILPLFQQQYFSMKSSGLLVKAASAPAPASSMSFGPSSPLRLLTDEQRNTARSVFGESLDFSTIYISNKTGAQGRPFTTAFPDSNETVQIMNLGTFTPRFSLLIHELTHVWQSQHHPDKYRFMKNSVASQGIALTANTGEILSDPDVCLHHEYPVNYPYSAYCYSPGGPFSTYAAEQMAEECELEPSGVVRARVKAVARNAVDAGLVTALQNAKIGDRRIAGNKC